MGCRMVCTGLCAKVCIYHHFHFLAGMDHAGHHMPDMSVFTAQKLNRILYLKYAVCRTDLSLIALLAAHRCIKRCLFYNNSSRIAVRKCLHDLGLCRHNRNFRSICQILVSDKFCCDGRINLLVNRCIRTHVVCHFTGTSGFLPLFFHTGLKLVLIIGKALFFKDFFGQIYRESVSIVKFECIGTGKFLFAVFLHLLHQVRQNGKSLIDGLIEFLFFLCQNLKDKFFLLFQFRISILALIDDSF